MRVPGAVRELATGFCVGVANIIPGVSGGTFLLVFGIFERVMRALDTFRAGFGTECIEVLRSLPHLPVSSAHRATVTSWLKRHDFLFLGRLLAGAALAILLLSGVMRHLLEHHFIPTYAFFCGLVLFSLPVPLRLVRKWHIALALPVAAGIGVTILVTANVNPAEKARTKSHQYHERLLAATDAGQRGTGYTPADYVQGVAAGALAVSAMVLPGLSGSLVLILVGQYQTVLGAIADLKGFSPGAVLFLSCFAAGLAAGLLLSARFLNWILVRWHNITMGFLVGLAGGSLWALWPFKEVETADLYRKAGSSIVLVREVVLQTNRNRLPSLFELALPLLFFAAGCTLMLLFSPDRACGTNRNHS